MTVVDTSVWIEYLRGNKEFSEPLIKLLNNRKVIALSAVFGELLQGARTKRENAIILGFWENLPHASENSLFIEAGNLSKEYSLISNGVGLIDCYILVFAMKYDFAVWTLDKMMQDAMDQIETRTSNTFFCSMNHC